MALGVDKVCLCRLLAEFLIQLFLTCNECHIHKGAGVRARAALKELGMIEVVIEQRRFFSVSLFRRRDSPILLQVLEYKPCR